MNTKSLTQRQKRQIAVYLHFKDRPMSVSALFWFNRRIYMLIVIVGLLSVAFAYWLNDVWLLTIVVVMYGTMLLRDAAYYWRSKSVWPVIREVIAWDKVQQLAINSSIAT